MSLRIDDTWAGRDAELWRAHERGEHAAALDVGRLADVLHMKVCGPFATIDPQQCVHGRQRDVALAAAISREYAAPHPDCARCQREAREAREVAG